MARLARSPLLQRIHWLRLTRIDDSILPVLLSLKNSTTLQVLELPGAPLTRDEYKALADLGSLWNLNLDDTGISDDNLKTLAENLHVKVLQARENRLTTASIPLAKKLLQLHQHGWFNIDSNHLAERDGQQFAKALPGVLVTYRKQK